MITKELIHDCTSTELHAMLAEYESKAQELIMVVTMIEEEIVERNATHVLVLDIETTGFQNQGGKIVEIGVVDLDLNTGAVTDMFHKVVREEGMTAKDRDAWIFSNSSLTIDEVRSADLLSDPITKLHLQDLFDKYQVTAYNRNFDIPFLESRGFSFPRLAPCPMLVMCETLGPGAKWPKVTETYAKLFPEEKYEEEHRGLQDARDEAKIIYKLFLQGAYKL